ncbi:hypothetical protein [Streptomyces cinnamoneus]|uniref:hypothetical protein n=1 Tax=Streptomyces cinnamoneus TaxID=53446 RepID=UPI0015E2D8E6|nr:hypothetical protein [Streptomyces cinnamoneus]
MPDITALAAQPAVIDVLAVSKGDQGPGALLRTVLIVGVVGIVLVAWFLLRGYRKND